MGKRTIPRGTLALVIAASTAATALGNHINDAYLVAGNVMPIANVVPMVTDATFATIMSNALIKDGQPNVKNASFFFQECFGGGMIDNLSDAFGNTIPWAAASASAQNQTAGGQYTNAEATRQNLSPQFRPKIPLNNPFLVSANPTDYWTPGLNLELLQEQTMVQAMTAAGARDPLGPQGTTVYANQETPQVAFGGGGNSIPSLAGATPAGGYYVILWAGNPNRTRHTNDINALYTTFTNLGATVEVLYGTGTAPAAVPWTPFAATSAQLVTTLADFHLNNTKSFLFYATDHGGTSGSIKVIRTPVAKNSSDSADYSIDATELSDINSQEVSAEADDTTPGFNPFAPYVQIDYDGLTTDNTAAVYAGTDLLGYLPANSASMDFNIPYADLGAADNLTIQNLGLDTFFINGETFYSGAETGDVAFIPEPAMLGILPLLFVLRRTRKFRHIEH